MTRPVRTGVIARPKIFAVLFCALLMVILSACSSSANSSPASSSGSTASSGSAAVKAAQAVAAQWEKAPTKLGLTTPLKSAPPSGKTFVWLNCELSACAQILVGVRQAASAAGWNLKVVQYQQANPATVLSAFKLALNYHPRPSASPACPRPCGRASFPPTRRRACRSSPAMSGRSR